MKDMLSELYEQADELKHDMAETALACNEITGRAWATLMQEHNEIVGTCLDSVCQQLEALTQSCSVQDLMVRETQVLTDFAQKMQQSLEEVRGIQRVANAELSLCLEDGWKAVQSRSMPAAFLGGAA